MDEFGQQFDLVIQRLGDAKTKKPLRRRSRIRRRKHPRYQEIKKLADGIVKQIDNLGDLKLDSASHQLKAADSILVMGPKTCG